jgi:hypothetical protein
LTEFHEEGEVGEFADHAEVVLDQARGAAPVSDHGDHGELGLQPGRVHARGRFVAEQCAPFSVTDPVSGTLMPVSRLNAVVFPPRPSITRGSCTFKWATTTRHCCSTEARLHPALTPGAHRKAKWNVGQGLRATAP